MVTRYAYNYIIKKQAILFEKLESITSDIKIKILLIKKLNIIYGIKFL